MKLRAVFRWLLGIFFVVAGINHFRDPAIYFSMMPDWIPWPATAIQLSGLAEIGGGVGVLVPVARRIAGWILIALLVAVFPANLHMALAHAQLPGLPAPIWVLWARLPFQAVFFAWVWWCAIAAQPELPPAVTNGTSRS